MGVKWQFGFIIRLCVLSITGGKWIILQEWLRGFYAHLNTLFFAAKLVHNRHVL